MLVAWFSFLIASGASARASININKAIGIDLNMMQIHVRLMPIFGMMSVLFAIYYAVQLTGVPHSFKFFGREIRFEMTDQEFKISFFGWIIRGKIYFVIVGILFLALVITSFKSQTMIRRFDVTAQNHVKIIFGPMFYILWSMIIIGVGKIMYFLIYALLNSKNKSYREFILLNMIAFNLIYVPAFFMLVVMPYLGYMTQFYASASFSVGVIVFYIAILRYQFSKVEELNIGLEKKVLERTEELKQAHTRMVQSEKMASLGQLVAGIAHEINNPVGAIKSMQQNLTISVDRLKNVLKDVPDKISGNDNYQLSMKVIDEANRVIGDGSKRVADIVSQLKSFARLDEADVQEIDIHGGIDDTLALLHHELKNCEEILKDYADLPKIPCYPGKLNQVWLNLLVNAKQAFKDGCGKIKISTGKLNDKIFVKIEDNGAGIPDENLHQIFNPGFTSKGVGVGTGLGLAICYQIIQDHNGEIKVESSEGEGTVFTVFLPEQQSVNDLDSTKTITENQAKSD